MNVQSCAPRKCEIWADADGDSRTILRAHFLRVVDCFWPKNENRGIEKLKTLNGRRSTSIWKCKRSLLVLSTVDRCPSGRCENTCLFSLLNKSHPKWIHFSQKRREKEFFCAHLNERQSAMAMRGPSAHLPPPMGN